ncbi:Hypothetical protein FORC18_3538 [Vibrio parahaemolyticus]|nr:hypothetical protein FORC8_3532 [Vibrio parahaemolyticus]APE86151.1 Hypothetical protein FORC18_3538 [Vibrio parahaemolyticus]AYF21925.1 hypothetical protein FORC71_3553 [Vibrio parahaemolyticus]BDP37543.1 hypothetical protein VA208B3_39140 [Vibrio alginolyticus]
MVSSEKTAALTSFFILLSLNEIYYHARSQYSVTLKSIQQDLYDFTFITVILD